MNELIAKKYVKALTTVFDIEVLQKVADVLEILAKTLEETKIKTLINAPDVSKEQKADILLGGIEKTGSKELENFIKLLVQKDRIALISDITTVLKKYIADRNKNYVGVVYSDSDIDQKILNELADGLSKKFDSTISLRFQKSDFDGIKVDVDGLGIEIGFSKSRINKQIVEHILKAI